jgi:protein MYSM1
MLLLFGTQTRLQKLLDSLKAHLFINNQDERIFLETVKDAITQDFITETQRLESTDTEAKEDIPNIR